MFVELFENKTDEKEDIQNNTLIVIFKIYLLLILKSKLICRINLTSSLFTKYSLRYTFTCSLKCYLFITFKYLLLLLRCYIYSRLNSYVILRVHKACKINDTRLHRPRAFVTRV